VIEFRNVSKIYGNGTVALDKINLRIQPGEFVFVVGASGAGKSTFLKLMTREEVPTHGSIVINSQELNQLAKREVPYFRRSLGMVFQDFRLIPNMTVYDNIAFAMRVIGTREKEIRKRVPYVISQVGLVSKARCLPNELSGGEQQRVGLARALANNAGILIADEPTGNVDPQMSYEIVELLMRLSDKGTTVVMVTHEHSLVKQFDSRVIILERGRVASDGKLFYGEAEAASRSHLNEHTTEFEYQAAVREEPDYQPEYVAQLEMPLPQEIPAPPEYPVPQGFQMPPGYPVPQGYPVPPEYWAQQGFQVPPGYPQPPIPPEVYAPLPVPQAAAEAPEEAKVWNTGSDELDALMVEGFDFSSYLQNIEDLMRSADDSIGGETP